MSKRILLTVAVMGAGTCTWLAIHNHTSKSKTLSEQISQTQTQSVVESTKYNYSAKTQETQNSTSISQEEDVLSDAVKSLLGMDDNKQNYNSMMRDIRNLTNDLSSMDVAALRDFLTWSNDLFPEGMRDIEINAVKNDVLDRLLRQKTLPDGIGLQLVEMSSDIKTDPVWRDYCIQFMPAFYERMSEEIRDAEVAQSDEQLSAVREIMMNALNENNDTIAGTALIHLENLSRTHEEFDREAVIAEASRIAADESVSNESRLTALRMSSLTGGSETTADTARQVAQTGETTYMRSAAIVTLGETGSLDDRELLESCALSENRQIAGAAKIALERMDARNL